MGDVPEQVYLDAAKVWARVFFPAEPDEVIAAHAPDIAATPNFRAAVASAYRAGQATTPDDEDEVTLGPGDRGKVGVDDIAMVVRATGALITSVEVIPEYEEDQAATPDGPRRWQLPDEPGPEVTAVRDRLGRIWSRVRGLPLWGSPETGSVLPFVDLLDHYGPLADATPAADGQDGRDG